MSRWYIVDEVPGAEIGYRAIVEADGTTVCDPSPMGPANARLIAAAPDLLAIAEGLIALEHQCKTHGLSMLALNARAAIAKATGA